MKILLITLFLIIMAMSAFAGEIQVEQNITSGDVQSSLSDHPETYYPYPVFEEDDLGFLDMLWIYIDPFMVVGGIITMIIGLFGWWGKSWISFQFEKRSTKWKAKHEKKKMVKK